MPPPILTLTTDFGLSDHYAGTMKGVILGICPRAQIVDITHEITPYAIAEGAYTIAQCYRYFPKGTVHVVVVDPGVGTRRRPILVESDGQYFVAPDNGVLSMIFAREKHRVRVIANGKLFLDPVSQTFHGRDIFSPVAAHVASGIALKRVGAVVRDYVRGEFAEPRRISEKAWAGQILKVDRFGNLVTNFAAAEFRRPFVLKAGGRRITMLARNYGEQAPGRIFVIAGSAGFLEVSINQASAAEACGCHAGDGVELTTR